MLFSFPDEETELRETKLSMVTRSYTMEPGGPPVRGLTSWHCPQRVPLPVSSGSEHSGHRLCWAERGSLTPKLG